MYYIIFETEKKIRQNIIKYIVGIIKGLHLFLIGTRHLSVYILIHSLHTLKIFKPKKFILLRKPLSPIFIILSISICKIILVRII